VTYWLETSGDALDPRPPLDGSVTADVAILGAGYTGLWTAWYLRRRDPSLRVVICEAEIAGFGASGRNGGWCVAGLGVTWGELARRTSSATARATAEALRATVDEVGSVGAEEGIDAQFHKGGTLRIARGIHELPSLQAAWRDLDGLGLADGCCWLGAAALAERVMVADGRAAIYDPHCAVLHPGRLARGLARAAERAGAVIYERTPVTAVGPGRLRTPAGDVRATAVVLAGEAWLSALRATRRAVLPLYSLIVLTEPLPASVWDEIGWERRECLSSRRYTVDYLARTADGRVVFGGRGAPYHYGSGIAPAYDRHAATHAGLRGQLTEWFPMMAGVGFTHAWGGPLGVTRDWMPTVRYDPATGLAGAWGYAGQGVAAANLAGRILADRITGLPSPFDELPFVGHHSRRWEPEPVRWLGIRYVQSALARLDARAARTGNAPTGRTLAERLVRH
jgi:glycine/D-amino acid oxidase-like deaminating enzyme